MNAKDDSTKENVWSLTQMLPIVLGASRFLVLGVLAVALASLILVFLSCENYCRVPKATISTTGISQPIGF